MHGVENLVDGSAYCAVPHRDFIYVCTYNSKGVACVSGKADFRKGSICHEGVILSQTVQITL